MRLSLSGFWSSLKIPHKQNRLVWGTHIFFHRQNPHLFHRQNPHLFRRQNPHLRKPGDVGQVSLEESKDPHLRKARRYGAPDSVSRRLALGRRWAEAPAFAHALPESLP